jgi:hypothetical protein
MSDRAIASIAKALAVVGVFACLAACEAVQNMSDAPASVECVRVGGSWERGYCRRPA